MNITSLPGHGREKRAFLFTGAARHELANGEQNSMKHALVASFAALGVLAAPALATTTATKADAKVTKSEKKAPKGQKFAAKNAKPAPKHWAEMRNRLTEFPAGAFLPETGGNK
jgi:hypothetical protein